MPKNPTSQLLQELELLWKTNVAACPGLNGKRWARVKWKKWVIFKWRRPNVWVLKVELWFMTLGRGFHSVRLIWSCCRGCSRSAQWAEPPCRALQSTQPTACTEIPALPCSSASTAELSFCWAPVFACPWCHRAPSWLWVFLFLKKISKSLE